jgi:hypothetical protein
VERDRAYAVSRLALLGEVRARLVARAGGV